MLHLKDSKQSSESKKKFWVNNRDLFQRYVGDSQHYDALINAGNFERLEAMRKENSNFNLEAWVRDYLQTDRLSEFKLN